MRSIRYTLPLLLLAGAASADAQQGFFFERPQAQLTLRAGSVMPRAQSDIFEFMTDELTLERGDFRAPYFGLEAAALVGNHVDIVFGLAWSESSASSQFRDWEGADGLPIAQVTQLMTIPGTMSVRVRPLDRGRNVADYAWLPSRFSPYVGGGVGYTWYRLEQEGEFLNVAACQASPETGCDIFVQTYTSREGGLTAHGMAGLEYWVTPRVAFSAEGRYTRGSAGLSQHFRSYNSIDLTHFEAGLGLSVRW